MLYESHGADLFFAELYFKEVYLLIKEYQDAYGAELRTFLETGAKIEIVERDDGYIDYNEGIPFMSLIEKEVECLANWGFELDIKSISDPGLIIYLFQKKN